MRYVEVTERYIRSYAVDVASRKPTRFSGVLKMNQTEAQELTSLLNKWAKKSSDAEGQEALSREPETVFLLRKIAMLLESKGATIEVAQSAAGFNYVKSYPMPNANPQEIEKWLKFLALVEESNKNKAVKA